MKQTTEVKQILQLKTTMLGLHEQLKLRRVLEKVKQTDDHRCHLQQMMW